MTDGLSVAESVAAVTMESPLLPETIAGLPSLSEGATTVLIGGRAPLLVRLAGLTGCIVDLLSCATFAVVQDWTTDERTSFSRKAATKICRGQDRIISPFVPRPN